MSKPRSRQEGSWKLDTYSMLIQESEYPEGDAVFVSRLGVVDSQVTVGDVLDLVEGLAFSSNLKEMLAVNKEITGLGVADFMRLRQLIEEEGLAQRTSIHMR